MPAKPLNDVLAALPAGVKVTGRVDPAPDEDNPPMNWYTDRELIHPQNASSIMPAEGRTIYDSIDTALRVARELLYA